MESKIQSKIYPLFCPYSHTFTDGNKDGSVLGRNLAALNRFINSWLTLSSR